MIGMLATALLILGGTGDAAPSPLELAKAIGRFTNVTVPAQNIRQIVCRHIPEEPTESRCYWQQRHGTRWRHHAGYLATDRSGWLLIDTPTVTRR